MQLSLRRKVIAADGHHISYLMQGGGPTLVMIPAVLQSAAQWDELGYLDHFATTHRVIAIDLLGHGESDKPVDPVAYAPEAVVGHIAAVLDEEAVDSAVVWGYGSGAETALLAARRRPDIFQGVVLGGMYLGNMALILKERGIDVAVLTERLARALDRGDWDDYFELLPIDVPPDIRTIYEATNRPEVVAAITRADLLRPREFLVPAADTLTYWGEDDLFASSNIQLSESLPIDCVIVPGCHSAAFLRVDQVADAVSGFIDSVIRV